MNVQTRVTRHSFFRGRAQFERFTEHAPLCVEASSHDLCNCTKTVTERPSGEPEQVSQTVELAEAVGKYAMRCELVAHYRDVKREQVSETENDCAVQFWVEWPLAPGKVSGQFGAKKEHAYFWFSRDDSLHVEVSGTGDNGDIDCTLGEVYFGNEVDASGFFNGHSPSHIADLSKFSPNDVWLHYSSFGGESVVVLADIREAEVLRRLRHLARQIKKDVAPHNTTDLSVSEVRARVDGTDAPRHAADAFRLIEKTLFEFGSSTLRRACADVHDQAISRSQLLRNAP